MVSNLLMKLGIKLKLNGQRFKEYKKINTIEYRPNTYKIRISPI